jgi:SAM-dependent methyltransferase
VSRSFALTGERVTTPVGGFNPTWQRHVAAYDAASRFLGPGRVLDVGCGVGHSYHRLAPRTTVGIDVAHDVLVGQDRSTAAADMRRLPFRGASFASIVSVQSIEHVPDPERAVAEMRRILEPTGVAFIVTPNRLTFGRPDEVLDPYHYIEFDQDQFRALCAPHLESVEVLGLFGSPRYAAIVAAERRRYEKILRLDPLRLRRLVPRRLLQLIYDRQLAFSRSSDEVAEAIGLVDFEVRGAGLETSLDVIAVCRGPRTLSA